MSVSPPSHALRFARASAELAILAGSFGLGRAFDFADKQLKSALILERYTRWLIALTIVLAVDVFYRVAMDFCHVHN